jgi:hypothetical protein
LKQLRANVGKDFSLYPSPLRQKKWGERETEREKDTHKSCMENEREEEKGKRERRREEEEGACLAAPGHGTKG